MTTLLKSITGTTNVLINVAISIVITFIAISCIAIADNVITNL